MYIYLWQKKLMSASCSDHASKEFIIMLSYKGFWRWIVNCQIYLLVFLWKNGKVKKITSYVTMPFTAIFCCCCNHSWIFCCQDGPTHSVANSTPPYWGCYLVFFIMVSILWTKKNKHKDVLDLWCFFNKVFFQLSTCLVTLKYTSSHMG